MKTKGSKPAEFTRGLSESMKNCNFVMNYKISYFSQREAERRCRLRNRYNNASSVTHLSIRQDENVHALSVRTE